MSSAQAPVLAGPWRPPRKDSLQNRPGILKRTPSSQSDDLSSDDSASTARSPTRPAVVPGPYVGHGSNAAASTTTLNSQMSRPIRKVSQDVPDRIYPPAMQHHVQHGHRRQHSQGFFEPSLPTTQTPVARTLNASQIAAQAAMHVQDNLHARRRSQTVPEPTINVQPASQRKASALSIQTSDTSNPSSRAPSQTRSGSGFGHVPVNVSNTAAREGAVKAAAAKSPLPSPVLQQGQQVASPTFINDRDPKPNKEKSRMKIFSKPKALNVSGTRDPEKKTVTIQDPPRRPGIYPSASMPLGSNRSLVSLAESTMSGASSFYSTANASTSTLTPGERGLGVESSKHRHNFLSRQRNKHKEGAEHYSSAASNSRPTDPNGPQPLYSFAPSSPGPGASFNMIKSKTGLDLRHGGRALREKKREEKATAGTFISPGALAVAQAREREQSKSEDTTRPPHSLNMTFGPPSTGAPQNAELAAGLGPFGLPGMTLDDAWPLLKARLLNIFEGEDIRTPIEDFNKMVLGHLKRCVQYQTPSLIIEDLRELLSTGFYSLDQVLRRIPDDRIVPHLVDTWTFVFGTVLPFMQAVFHPLDLEFKGQGQVLSAKEARDFWGALPFAPKPPVRPTTPTTSLKHPTSAPNPQPALRSHLELHPLGSILSVRTIALLTFRDTIILPRYNLLLSTFSRLPLENLQLTAALEAPRSPPPFRPGTATSSTSSHNLDPVTASFNSQSSTLLDSSAGGSLGARSRATSNTSAMSNGSFQSIANQRPHAGSSGSIPSGRLGLSPLQRGNLPPSVPPLDSTKVTQTAGRMLQCVSVLAGLQAPGMFSTLGGSAGITVAKGDDGEEAEAEARQKMEDLGKELKLNWLGRSRTGRNRRGLVGTTRTPGPTSAPRAVGVAA